MQAKVINFPKYPKHYHEFYYFREYFHVFFHVVLAWTLTIFVFIYEVNNVLGIGFGLWLVGVVLIVNFMIRLGLKRKEQELQQQGLHKLKKVDL